MAPSIVSVRNCHFGMAEVVELGSEVFEKERTKRMVEEQKGTTRAGFDLGHASEAISDFASARDWEQFHTPRNLMLALVGEIGELAELMQWRTEQEFLEFWKSPEGGIRVREEFADILIYLIRIAQVIGINPAEAISEKLERNESRFPISEAYGHAYRPEQ